MHARSLLVGMRTINQPLNLNFVVVRWSCCTKLGRPKEDPLGELSIHFLRCSWEEELQMQMQIKT